MADKHRRRIVKTGLLGGFFSSVYAQGLNAKALLLTTPEETEGPFYPLFVAKDKDFDLTEIKGSEGVASGRQVYIEGRVLDENGLPIENAIVDLWQANSNGRYRHPYDRNPSPLDPHFQGWAIVHSSQQGKFRFKTIVPGAYPASRNWVRPPHIHFKITKQGFTDLVTQMYFPEEKLNTVDLLLQRKSKAEQALMIAKHVGSEQGLDIYRYDVVLDR